MLKNLKSKLRFVVNMFSVAKCKNVAVVNQKTKIIRDVHLSHFLRIEFQKMRMMVLRIECDFAEKSGQFCDFAAKI